MSHLVYPGAGVALDADNVIEMTHQACQWGSTGSSANIPNMQRKFALNKSSSLSALPDDAYYIASVGTNASQAIELFDAKVWAFRGELADLAQVQTPAGVNQGKEAAMVWAVASETAASGGALEAGGFAISTLAGSGVGPVKISGTANFAASNTPNALCVYGANSLYVRNRLGVPADVVVFVVFST
jgi:hypothetical protein